MAQNKEKIIQIGNVRKERYVITDPIDILTHTSNFNNVNEIEFLEMYKLPISIQEESA